MAVNIRRFVSADSHLMEPENLWVEHMDKRFRDEAPRNVIANNGVREWVVKDLFPVPENNPIFEATDEKQGVKVDLSEGSRTRPGAMDPKLRLLDQDMDSIAAEVTYPHLALQFFGIRDPAYQR